MNHTSVRKLLCFTMLMVFFLTSIPYYGHAQSAHPVTYEQAKMARIKEIMKELRLDQLDQGNMPQASAAGGSNSLLPSLPREFDDVKDFLSSTHYTSWTGETYKKAYLMTVERIDPAKAKELQQSLGISDETLEKIGSLIGDVHGWFQNHPVACAAIVALVIALAAAILWMIIMCALAALQIAFWPTAILLDVASAVIAVLYFGAAITAATIVVVMVCSTEVQTQ